MNKYLILLLVLFSSCSSVKKIVSKKKTTTVVKTEEKKDSVSVSKVDSSSIFIVDSSHIDEYGIEVELDSSDNTEDEKNDTVAPKKRKTYTYVVDGKEITTPTKAKKISITNKSTGRKITTAANNYIKQDSTAVSTDTKADIKTAVVSSEKTVKRISTFWLMVGIGVMLLLAALYYINHLRRQSRPTSILQRFFKPKNRDNEQTKNE